jgi:antimicrobial peptide system SdpA family protein
MTSGRPRNGSAKKQNREADDRRLGRTVVAIAAFWALFGFYIVHAQLPSNTLELPGQETLRIQIQQVLPQGWAFFTKSPRDPQMVAWRLGDTGDWESSLYAPHAEPRNVFGLNRRSRAQPVEMALLVNSVPADKWQDCEHGDIPVCLAETTPVPIDNPSPEPLFCGRVGISRQPPVPWAWSGSDDVRMPATVLQLEVRC